jgi:nitrite reductase/ring-hydroxylating ferredoxin subunit
MIVCESAQLREGGTGKRFEVERGGLKRPAFAIRYQGVAHAYINRCAHIGVELDWQQGRFFDDTGRMLICATHGALYEPATGRCVEGPCRGQALEKLALEEAAGLIHYPEQDGTK